MDELDKILKRETEARDELINQAEAIVDSADGGLSADEKKKYDDLINKVNEKDNYISAKKWQAQEQAKRADSLRNHDDGEAKEFQSFSYSEFLMSAIPGMRDNLSNKKLGFYDELSREAKKEAKKYGLEVSGSGRLIPMNVLKAAKRSFRGDLTIGTEGGDITFDQDGGFIDQLNERMVLTSLGADFMTGLTGDVKFPRETNAPTATWEGETDANAESTPTFDNVSMSPKRVGTYIDVSNQAILQTNPSIDARIKRQMVGSMQRALETAAINGSGTAPVPRGILNVSGIGSVAVGTNGGAQTWAHWIDNETEVAQDNADIGSLAYLTNAKVRGEAKQIFIDTGSGRTIWPVNANEVNGYRVGVSNLVPSNLTKGTSSGVCSALIFGNFNDLVIGQWGGLEVLVDPYTQATSGITRMVINVYADVAVLRPQSFSATQDITT